MQDREDIPRVGQWLKNSPKNWGRWGSDDELGALNLLDAHQVLRGVQAIRSGRTFTLGTPLADPDGDPVWPGRRSPQRITVRDRGDFLAGAGISYPGGWQDTEDMVISGLHSTSHIDALGHVWYDDQVWNGYPAEVTAGGMQKAGALPLAQHGIVGRGVLIDMARARGKLVLERGESFSHIDLLRAADIQGVEIRPRDILVIRTGWIGSFYTRDRQEFYRDFLEPGLGYSDQTVSWFKDMDIVNLSTDTIGNELTVDPESGIANPLHHALMRNLGVTFIELLSLDELAADCADDGQWEFLFAAGPVKIAGSTGAPVNPIAIK